MSKKRLFQLLDEMNVADSENKTSNLAIANTFVKSDLTKQGTLVTMGASPEISMKLFMGEVVPILLLIDSNEFKKLQENLSK